MSLSHRDLDTKVLIPSLRSLILLAVFNSAVCKGHSGQALYVSLWDDIGTLDVGPGATTRLTRLGLPPGVAGVGAMAANSDPVQPELYLGFTNRDQIVRYDLKTRETDELAGRFVWSFVVGSLPKGVAFDPVGRRVYWTEPTRYRLPSVSAVQGAPADFKVSVDLHNGTDDYSGTMMGLAIDPVAGMLYWGDKKTGTITRARLDGSRRQTILSEDIREPTCLALDWSAGRLYWADAKTERLESANVTGGDRAVLVPSGNRYTRGLAVTGDFVYWSQLIDKTLDRVRKTDGSLRERLAENLSMRGLAAIDLSTNDSLRLEGGRNGTPWFEVTAHDPGRLECGDLDPLRPVYWLLDGETVATCLQGNTECTMETKLPNLTASQNDAVISASRPSSVVSVLAVDGNPIYSGALGSSRIACLQRNDVGHVARWAARDIHFIVPAVVDDRNCSVQFSRMHDGKSITYEDWRVQGSCSILLAYSTRGNYSCTWFQAVEGSEEWWNITDTLPMTTAPYPAGGPSMTGSCALDALLPLVEGKHRYSVVTSPGDRRHIVPVTGPLGDTVAYPVPPTLTCDPSGFIPNRSNVSCMCSTPSLGLPPGRLYPYLMMHGEKNSYLMMRLFTKGYEMFGAWGATRKALTPLNLVFRGESVKFAACDVEWARNGNDTKGVPYPLKVGYQPDYAELTINGSTRSKSVAAGSVVELWCRAWGGTPGANFVEIKSATHQGRRHTPPHGVSSSVHGSGEMGVTLHKADCEDAGYVTCTSGNGMGPNVTSSATLYVTCAPRTPTKKLGPVRLWKGGKAQTATFDVLAYPAPELSFAYLGDSVDNPPQTDFKKISLGKSCADSAGGQMGPQFTCVITVYDVGPAATGLYRVTASNHLGWTTLMLDVVSDSNGGLDSDGRSGGPSSTATVLASRRVLVATATVFLLCLLRFFH